MYDKAAIKLAMQLIMTLIDKGVLTVNDALEMGLEIEDIKKESPCKGQN